MSDSNLAVMRGGQYSNESKGLPSWGRDEYEQSEEQLSQKQPIQELMDLVECQSQH